MALWWAKPSWAAVGVNDVISFQGKVVNSDGTNVTDGVYGFEFKLYDGAGSAATTKFTETWATASLFSSTMSSAPSASGESLVYSSDTNESTLKVGQILTNTTKAERVIITSVDTGTNTLGISPTFQAWDTSDTVTNQIYVQDGVFKVNLNSLNDSWGTADFNTDNLFLGVNFNTDGEMKPRVQFTAVPYAMNAKEVMGITAAGTYDIVFTATAATDVTLPTTGTLATLAGVETLTSKTIGTTGLVFDSGASTEITTINAGDLVIDPYSTYGVDINGAVDITGTTTIIGGFDVTSSNNSPVDFVYNGGTYDTGLDGFDFSYDMADHNSDMTVNAMHISTTPYDDPGNSLTGLRISHGSNPSGTLYGLAIDAISGGSGTEYALDIGSGWDRGLNVSAASYFTSGSFSSALSTSSTFSSDSTLTVGTSGNTFTFNPASGPVYAGTARPTKTVTLVPEFAGAVITADGSSNTGTMVSDFCSNGNTNPANMNTGVCTTSGDIHNYYSWFTTEASAQDYDVWVRYQIPSDFAAFAADDTIKVWGWRTDSTNNTVNVSLYDNSDAQCGSTTNVATGTATWTQTALTGSETGCTGITAGTWVTFLIKLTSDTNDYTRVGEITFSYYAKF